MQQEMRIKPLQALGLVKDNIGCVFGLRGAPVVTLTSHGSGDLFADFAAAQILDRASGFAKELVRSSLDSVTQLLSKTAEVLDQYPAAIVQECVPSLRRSMAAQSTARTC